MLGDLPKVHFPVPPRYWDIASDAPSYQLWLTQFENYVYSIDLQRPDANKWATNSRTISSTLLGMEGIAHFACTPEAQDPAGPQI